MKAKKLSLYNFRSFEKLDLEAGSRLNLLVGENGTGKTTLLDALSIALGAVLTILPETTGIGFKKTDNRQVGNRPSPFMRVSLETTEGILWDRIERRDKRFSTGLFDTPVKGVYLLRQYIQKTIIDPYFQEEEFLLPVFSYYGVSRALLEAPLRRRGFPKTHNRFEAYSNTLESVSRFKSAFIWFYNKENEELRKQKELKSFAYKLPELETVRRAIITMFPDLSDPHIMTNPLRFAVKAGNEVLDITQLSDGYKTLFALVIDLASRMAIANPQLENPLTSPAIVMVDEIDLHLHPEWQKRVVGQLLQVFPNTQFFLTTHSPYIIESVNNLLMRHRLTELKNEETDSDIVSLYPLPPADVKAYYFTRSGMVSIMDDDIQLIDDKLIHPFNSISAQFDRMSDLAIEEK